MRSLGLEINGKAIWEKADFMMPETFALSSSALLEITPKIKRCDKI